MKDIKLGAIDRAKIKTLADAAIASVEKLDSKSVSGSYSDSAIKIANAAHLVSIYNGTDNW